MWVELREALNKNTWAGNPAAPRIVCLSLLPLGPDEVRKVPPRRTNPGGQSIPQVRVHVKAVVVEVFGCLLIWQNKGILRALLIGGCLMGDYPLKYQHEHSTRPNPSR